MDKHEKLLNDSMNDESESDNNLRRTLGFWDGTCILISIIVGSGIFSSPGETLDRSGSPGGALLAWALSGERFPICITLSFASPGASIGMLVILASFCYAELGAYMPSTGGDFDYIRKAYGDLPAFSFAWFFFWISKTGSLAIISTVFGNYVVKLFAGLNSDDDTTESEWEAKSLAVGLIILLTGLNMLGVKKSSTVVNLLTVLKILLIITVAAVGVYYCSRHHAVLSGNLAGSNAFQGTSVIGMFTAMIPCLWAYDGWSNLNFLAEEMVDFEKRLPKAIVGAVVVVMCCYLVANIAYLSVLTQEQIVDSNAIAVDFGQHVQSNSDALAGFFAAGVAMAAAGSAHGSMMTGARAFFAVARNGMAPSVMASINRKGAPYIALFAQSAWTLCLLMLPGSSFSSLLDYTGPASWVFYAITGSTVVALRSLDPDGHRPFKCPWYPVPPVLLCVMSLFLVITSLYQNPLFVGLGLGFVVLSVPVWYLKKWYESMHAFDNDGDDSMQPFLNTFEN